MTLSQTPIYGTVYIYIYIWVLIMYVNSFEVTNMFFMVLVLVNYIRNWFLQYIQFYILFQVVLF